MIDEKSKSEKKEIFKQTDAKDRKKLKFTQIKCNLLNTQIDLYDVS